MDYGLLWEGNKSCLDLIEKLEPIFGLKLKWLKISVHAPYATNAQLCRHLIPKIEVIEDEEMNFVYLKSRIGSIMFVKIIQRIN